MDLLTFIAEIIKAVAWPIAAIVLAVLYRASIVKLLERVKSAKGPGFEAEFGEQLSQIQREADEADLPPATTTPVASDDRPPPTRVFESWQSLEMLLNELYLKAKGSPPRTYSDLRGFFYELVDKGRLQPQVKSIYNRLRIIRNRAVHPQAGDTPISEVEAKEYADLTARLVEELKAVEQ